jgi:hypothetical protein
MNSTPKVVITALHYGPQRGYALMLMIGLTAPSVRRLNSS